MKATNDQGNEELSDLDFTIIDNTNPVITVNEVFAQSPNAIGTPFSRFDYSVTDNYELSLVKREILKVDGSGNETGLYYSSETNIPLFEKTHNYSVDFELTSGNEGANYRARITATDAAGNVEIWTSAVMKL